MLKAVEKKRAYEDIVNQIRTLIAQGKLKTGDQLPSERELSETFKVSRATVREAIRALESMNLLQSRQGNGTYVLATSEEALIQPLAKALFTERDDLLDIFAIRKIIEPYIAQLAARNATSEEIANLEKILQKQKACLESGESTVEVDTAFHNAMAKMAKNRVMERLLLALVDLMKETREEYLMNEQRAQKSLEGHLQVFFAIKNRESKAACKAMLGHLEEVESVVFPKKRVKSYN